MFELPQSPNTDEHGTAGLPVIDISEDSETLYPLLMMLYPSDPPEITSYELAAELVKACDKYEINVMRLRAFLHDILSSTASLESNPLGVYALAWRLGLEDEAKKASRYTHKLDLSDPQIKREMYLRSGSINCILALWEMRLRREEQLDNLIKLAHKSDRICASHRQYQQLNMLPEKGLDVYAQIRQAAKASLVVPYPTCTDIDVFFGLSVMPPITFSYSYGQCYECTAGAHSAPLAECNRINDALKTFPQTIESVIRD